MAVEKISIHSFRGFQNVSFELGHNITLIAGQNGTQKTTLLGILTQPFSITDKTNPIYKEKPLCGGNYISDFAGKFKLSENFDKPKNHEWTITYDNGNDFTVESIKPNDGRSAPIRFWKKGNRSKGSGYIQKPVIYLSMSRLFPIGEDDNIHDAGISLTPDEQKLYMEMHDKILCIQDEPITKLSHLQSEKKNTLGANTDKYDWKMNSAGQDDLGKIILALLSFKRLKENHPHNYTGGILAIDELDATLFPKSQYRILEILDRYSKDFQVQIFFTTHSISLIEHFFSLKPKKSPKDFRLIYLKKLNGNIQVFENQTFEEIKLNLEVKAIPIQKPVKFLTFTEDKEAQQFAKCLLGPKRTKYLDFVNCSLSCNNLLELVKKKIPTFCFPNSIVILDGDASSKSKAKNFICLPGQESPERELAKLLHGLDDNDPFWNSCGMGYNKQFLFDKFKYEDLFEEKSRMDAKRWFQSQLKFWGQNGSRAINRWKKENEKSVQDFLAKFDELLKKTQEK